MEKSLIFHKSIAALLALLLIGVCVSFGLVMLETHRQLETSREREAVLLTELEKKRELYARQKEYLRKMMTDPDFFEKVVRERLGYSREGELVFRFEER